MTPSRSGQFLVYQTQDGKLKIDVRFEGETVWLTQQQMGDLFQTTKQNVSLHIQNIYDEKELDRSATVKESLTVQQEGKRSVQHSLLQDGPEQSALGHHRSYGRRDRSR